MGGGTTTIIATCEGVSCEWKVESNLEWKKIYADYFSTNSEFREKFCGEFDDSVCGEAYINSDNIPEVVVAELSNFKWSIYSIINQKVKCVWDDCSENTYWGSGTSYRWFDYIEKTGLFFLYGTPGGMHAAYEHFYILDNKGITSRQVAFRYDEQYYWETGEDRETYYYGENEISEDEFNNKLKDLSSGQWIGEDESGSNTDDFVSIPIDDFIATYQ